VRNDRLSSLRQRLKRGTFEFGALLEGVSTLEQDEATQIGSQKPPVDVKEKIEAKTLPAADEAPTDVEEARPTLVIEEFSHSITASNGVLEEAVLETITEIAALPTAPAPPEEIKADIPKLFPVVAPALSEPAITQPSASTLNREERLRIALDMMGGRLMDEVGRLRSALQEEDPEEAGFHLAHVNQMLDILATIDPQGDMARQFCTKNAPPVGRTWPKTAWSLVEFAESPFSALLPPKANEAFIRSLLYAAWGVTFEPAR
jgi:hypothetical protein